MSALNWIYANWQTIAPFAALVLPFFVKLPFVAHSSAAEVLLSLLGKLLPSDPDPTVQPVNTAKVESAIQNPKK